VPIAGRQVTVFLFRRSRLCRRVSSQPFSAGVGLRQWCVVSPLLFIVCIKVLHTTTGQIRPTKPSHPAAKHISPIIKKSYVYEKYVDLVECKNVLLSNCCAIAYVVSPKKCRVLVYMNWIGSHRHVDEGVTVGNCKTNRLFLRKNWYCIRGSSQQGLQHAFDRFYAACDQEATKIRSKKIEVGYYVSPKAVFPASKRQYTAAGGEVQVPWGGIHE